MTKCKAVVSFQLLVVRSTYSMGGIKMARIEKLKEKYKGEWLAIELTKEKEGRTLEVKFLRFAGGWFMR